MKCRSHILPIFSYFLFKRNEPKKLFSYFLAQKEAKKTLKSYFL